jgi:trehalose synthase
MSGLTAVRTRATSLDAYAPFIERRLSEKLDLLASPLRGLRVVHINATPAGGGVAEILGALVPLSRSVGLDARWYALPPDDRFFEVTKRMHNWLQGKGGRLARRDREVYTTYSERVAARIKDLRADVWVVHDPQPLALRSLAPLRGPAVWRCHIDCSAPNGGVCSFLLPFLHDFDRLLFTMPTFCLDGLRPDQVGIIHPAIDPLAAKNRRLATDEARAIVSGLGIDSERPLVSQVSRFDPWKNPWQAVDAYRLAKREIPGLQLALVGVFSASDDPEAPRVYNSVRRYVGRDPDVHLFIDPSRVGPREVAAFQTASAAILQRSSREGFALTVTEAMWKRTPVIGTPVGGIVVQIEDGQNGFLTDSAEECAEHIVDLVRQPKLAHRIGRAAQESVRRRFLMPRLLADHLALYAELSAKRTMAA